MPQLSPRLSLPYLEASQAQKHVTHNEALQIIDALTLLRIEAFGLTAPPVGPTEGQVWQIGTGPGGTFTGQAGNLALWNGSGWVFITPQEGWLAWDGTAAALKQLVSGNWGPWQPVLQNISGLGIQTSWDSTNRLAVASAATLFTHAGAGHQLKLNKNAAGDTASLLFQTGFSGRAEMGTAGSDAFAVKVSPDGSAWATGLALSTGGVAALLAGARIGGKLAYHRGNVVGTVSQTSGTPTGALVERGTGANGDWVRLADGTQICWKLNLSAATVSTADGALFKSANVSWIFPAAFSAAPAVSGAQAASLDCWASAGTVTATTATCRLRATVTKGSATAFGMVATGRWF